MPPNNLFERSDRNSANELIQGKSQASLGRPRSWGARLMLRFGNSVGLEVRIEEAFR